MNTQQQRNINSVTSAAVNVQRLCVFLSVDELSSHFSHFISMIGATALLSTGMINHDHGITISQRLIKANNDFEPPKKKKYNPIKNVNDRLWGYFEEFQDYVHIGDSVQLRSIIKECPNFTHYFELYDKRLNELLVLYNQFIEHARLGEHIGVMQVFKSCPEFTHLVHSFVENIDVKKQCNALHLLARKKDSPQLMQYVRNHSEMVSTMSAKFDKIQASSTRAERVAEFNDLLERVREGDNASIRVLRRTDPHITRDIADIIECDRLIHFDTMLVCALEGNASYMAYLVDLHPHLVNYISEQVGIMSAQEDHCVSITLYSVLLQGESILLNAVKNQHLSTVKALTNCDFNTTDRVSSTSHCSQQQSRSFSRSSTCFVCLVLPQLGRSALHITCEGLMKPLAHYFIHNGANVDAIDKVSTAPALSFFRSMLTSSMRVFFSEGIYSPSLRV